MRTVTFSNSRIAALVNSKFIPVWINRGPGFHNCEFRTEERIRTTSREAYSTRNICTFFLTPDERVLHYVAGYYSPELFREVLNFVVRLGKEVKQEGRFQEIHKRASELLRKQTEKISVQMSRRRGDGHDDRSRRLHHLSEALNYWTRLHSQFANRNEPPTFAQVRSRYLAGNNFSEEPGKEKKKKRRPDAIAKK